MPDLLVEIGCEELPAAACRQAEAQLPGLLEAELRRAGLASADRRVYVAPRRLGVIATGLPAERPAERTEARGPRADAPDQALAGFARKHGLDPPQLERRDGFVWAVSEGEATPVAALARDIVRGLVEGIQFSNSMRWEGGRFSRPIRWLVVKLDDDVAPMRLAGLESGETTFGHRYEGGHARIGSAATYLEDLRAVRAMADASERRGAIVAGLDAAGPWTDPGAKLEEVVHLVEWPVVLAGRFDRRYLDLPDRVVITAMQSHQRYFPVRGGGGDLEPRFFFVANGGDPEVVRAGNEEVLAGRLDDAAFAHRRDLDARPRGDGGRARAGELPRRRRLDCRQGGAPRAAGRAPVCRKRPRRGGAGRRRPRRGAVQGRPGVRPRERVCRPRGLRGLAVRAGRRRGGCGLRRHRGAPPAPRGGWRAPGERGRRCALDRRQGRHARRRIRARPRADREPRPVRPAEGRGRRRCDRP